jgi:chromosome segregation ATPase
MDKKVKKKIEVLRERLKRLQQQLTGAKKQPDDLPELERLTREVASVEAELERLKTGA